MKAKTHEEWYIGAMKRFDEKEGKYYNALLWYPGRKAGQRYVRTEAEARKVLEYAYTLWNGEKIYNSEGKRYEHQNAGSLGFSIESDRQSDYRQEIVKHVIKKRTVTEWEEVE